MSGIKGISSSALKVDANRIYGTGIDTRDCGVTAGVSMDRVRAVRVSHNVVQDFVVSGIWVEETDGVIDHNSVRFYHYDDTIGDPARTVGIRAQWGTVSVTDNTVHRALSGAPRSRWLAKPIAAEHGTYHRVHNVVSKVPSGIDLAGDHATDVWAYQVIGNALSLGDGTALGWPGLTGVPGATNTIRDSDGEGIAAIASGDSVIAGKLLEDVIVDAWHGLLGWLGLVPS
jgi:hypothetical protein